LAPTPQKFFFGQKFPKMLSEYEQQRQKNIASNELVLKQLGLAGNESKLIDKKTPNPKKKKKKTRDVDIESLPLRQPSLRQAGREAPKYDLPSDYDSDPDFEDGRNKRKRNGRSNAASNKFSRVSGRQVKAPENFAAEQGRLLEIEEKSKNRRNTNMYISTGTTGATVMTGATGITGMQSDLEQRFVPFGNYDINFPQQYQEQSPLMGKSSWFTTKQKQQCPKCKGFFTVNSSGKMHKHSCIGPSNEQLMAVLFD
jgi:hypothetical protein